MNSGLLVTSLGCVSSFFISLCHALFSKSLIADGSWFVGLQLFSPACCQR